MRKFFPRYFFFLGLTSAVAALGAPTPTHQAALLACTLIFFFSCFWLTPRINRARDAQKSAAFKRLHWASVGLNMAQLFTFIWLLFPSGHTA